MQESKYTQLFAREFPGTVYSLGIESTNAAELYAGLSGRPYVRCNRVSEMELGQNDVVVTTCANLTVQLMQQMFILPSAGCPGLICAPAEDDLMDTCRRQVARLKEDPDIQPAKRVFVYPQHSFASLTKGTDHFIGGGEQTDSLVESLSSNAALLAIISTHSDGIGFLLSLRHFACPMVSIAESNNERIPTCRLLGKCIRFPVAPTIQEAHEAGWLIPLSTLRAGVLLILGCNIVRLQDGIIDPCYGLASTLFSQATFGVTITTWRREYSPADGVHLNSLLNELALGMPVGEAVFRFNQSQLAKQIGLNLCVLGDPCFSLSPKLSLPSLPTIEAVGKEFTQSRSDIEPTTFDQARLLKDVAVAASSNRFFDAVKGNSLSAALSCYASSETPGSPGQELDDLDSSFLDFASATPWLDRLFSPFSRLVSSHEEGACPICLAPARSIVVRFPQHSDIQHHIVRCACCDDSCILPTGWSAEVDLSRVNERRIVVTVPEHAKALLCLGTFSGTTFTSWGDADMSRTQYIFQIPEDLPSLPIHCQVLIARHLKVGAIAFRLRKLANGQISTPRSISNTTVVGVS